jgi:2-hydroxy-6-oxonona-2,4-dienedioate hydrolase
MPIADNQITLHGNTLHWYESGQGLPVILLHGGGGTGRAFLSQLDYLGSRGIRVLAPDMPGFGKSDWFDGISRVPHIGPVLYEWLDVLGLTAAVVGGNSMGGRVALSMASQHPERVRGLVILDSVGLTLADVPVVNPLTLPMAQYTQGLVYDAARYKAHTPYRTLDDARELNRGRGSFARYMEEGELRPDPGLQLDRLSMPTLLVWGREDKIVPLAYGQALNDALADSELLIIDQCGHLPHIEEADITNRAIFDFLDRKKLL